MSTSAGLGKVKQATKDLRAHWEEVRAFWHDDNCREFESEFVIPLLSRMRKMELTLTHMGAVLQRVHRDCE